MFKFLQVSAAIKIAREFIVLCKLHRYIVTVQLLSRRAAGMLIKPTKRRRKEIFFTWCEAILLFSHGIVSVVSYSCGLDGTTLYP